MTKKVFISKFNYNIPTGEFKKIITAVAPEFSAIPGCNWKIWIINKARKEAGGVYLFESDTELDRFLNSKLLASVVNDPALSNFEINIFDIEEEASALTRAPLTNRKSQ